ASADRLCGSHSTCPIFADKLPPESMLRDIRRRCPFALTVHDFDRHVWDFRRTPFSIHTSRREISFPAQCATAQPSKPRCGRQSNLLSLAEPALLYSLRPPRPETADPVA